MSNALYILKAPRVGIVARARFLDNGTVRVLAGSTARAENCASLSDTYRKSRKALKADGTLQPGKDGLFYFTKDHDFDSGSWAASVILGIQANANGWKPKGKSETAYPTEPKPKNGNGSRSKVASAAFSGSDLPGAHVILAVISANDRGADVAEIAKVIGRDEAEIKAILAVKAALLARTA